MIVLIEVGMGLLLTTVLVAAVEEAWSGLRRRRGSLANTAAVTPFRADGAGERAKDVEAA